MLAVMHINYSLYRIVTDETKVRNINNMGNLDVRILFNAIPYCAIITSTQIGTHCHTLSYVYLNNNNQD